MALLELKERRKEVRVLKRQLEQAKDVADSTESEIKRVKEELLTWKENYETQLETEKEKQLELYLNEAGKELLAKLEKVQERRQTVVQEYNVALEKINSNAYRESLYDDSLVGFEELVQQVDANIASALSDDFLARVYKELNTVFKNSSLEEEDLDYIRIKLEELKDQEGLTDISEKMEVLDDMSEYISKLGDEEEITSGHITLAVALLVVIFLFGKVLLPVYLLLLLLLAIFNVRRHNKLFSALSMLSAAQANIALLKEAADEAVGEQIEEAIEECEERFQLKLEKIDDKIVGLKEQLELAKEEARTSFKFNKMELSKSLAQTEAEYNDKLNNLTRRHQEEEGTIVNLQYQLELLETSIEEDIKNIKNVYMDFSRMGTDYVLDPTFLLDIDTSGAPVLWEFPQTNLLIVCDDEEEIRNFIYLLVAQLRNRLNPFALKVSIYDVKYSGVPYLKLVDENSFVGKLLIDKDTVVEDIVTQSNLSRQRIRNMLVDKNNIDEYNRYMLEIDSATASYNFIFVPNRGELVTMNETFKQLLLSSSRLGIFFMVFCTEEELVEHKYDEILDGFGACYTVRDGNLTGWAKDYINDLIKQKREKR